MGTFSSRTVVLMVVKLLLLTLLLLAAPGVDSSAHTSSTESDQTPRRPPYDTRLPYDGSPCYASPSEYSGLCRPSYLIVGAGKAGTSSMYYYLNDHPDVLPALRKQTHFWKYDVEEGKPFRHYLSNFPNSTSFRQPSHAVPDGGPIPRTEKVTGESSPGYLPHARAASHVRTALGADVKIVVVVRDPVGRALSSYRYNYLAMVGVSRRPAGGERRRRRRARVEEARGGADLGADGGADPADDDKFKHATAILSDDGRVERAGDGEMAGAGAGVVSFKDFVEAEMEWIERCAGEPGGPSAARRDLMAECLTDPSSLEEQWRNVTAVGRLEASSEALVRSMLGRGFYTQQMQPWLEGNEVHVTCLEHLTAEDGADALSAVASFIGLRPHDFSETVAKQVRESIFAAAGEGRKAKQHRCRFLTWFGFIIVIITNRSFGCSLCSS